MKNLNFFLGVGIFLFLQSFLVQSQTRTNAEATSLKDPDREVYWFYVSLRIEEDKELHKTVYKFTREKTIKYKSVKEYEKDLWMRLQKAEYVCIGPFDLWETAEQANYMYDLDREKRKQYVDSTQQAAVDSSKIPKKKPFKVYEGEVFWFFVSIYRKERPKSFDFNHIPARVASGTMQDFDFALREGLTNKLLAIGPFWSQTEAEEAKRLLRIEE